MCNTTNWLQSKHIWEFKTADPFKHSHLKRPSSLALQHADHTQDEVDARKALLDKDLEFKARFSEVNPSRDLRQLMSNSDGELEFISR